jgi:hypothetical protein
MPEEKESSAKSGASKEEVALELMRFIATTTGVGKTGTGAGFGGRVPKSADDQVEALLQLYDKCRAVVNKG